MSVSSLKNLTLLRGFSEPPSAHPAGNLHDQILTVIKTTASKNRCERASTSGNRMKPVHFNATYDAGVSKIGCFFTIVERFAAGN
jgi:hypothetical protein